MPIGHIVGRKGYQLGIAIIMDIHGSVCIVQSLHKSHRQSLPMSHTDQHLLTGVQFDV